MFGNKVIYDIVFIRSKNNIADGLTKQMKQITLRIALHKGSIVVELKQWIIRRTTQSVTKLDIQSVSKEKIRKEWLRMEIYG